MTSRTGGGGGQTFVTKYDEGGGEVGEMWRHICQKIAILFITINYRQLCNFS